MRRSALVLVLMAACGGGDESAVERPGSAAVYAEIDATTDCGALQETFDRAAANNERAEPGSTEHRWTLGYMKAAEDRRRSLDC